MSNLDRIEELAAEVIPDVMGLGPQSEQEEELAKWRISTKAEAAWAMEKLAGYVRQQEENQAVADDRMEAIRRWCRRENAKFDYSIEFFTEQLRTWHMSLVTANPEDEDEWKKEKFKTINLPDGAVSVRKGSYSTVIEDREALTQWAKENHDDLLELALVPTAKSKVADIIKDTGEVIPGVKYERSQPKFDVKPKVGE
jgi:hypothetical protein